MENEEAIDQNEVIQGRTRRTFQLANFCIANIAAYRVNWNSNTQQRKPIIDNDFWIRANGTLFDMSVIEWCKLFADHKGKHHWSRTFSNKDEWKSKLLHHMGMTEEEYDFELMKLKEYRDKYATHLDDPKSMNYPLTEIMLRSASFLYDCIKNNAETKIHIIGVYDSAQNYYSRLINLYEHEIQLRLSHPI